ncbi:MAG: hypothetical protein IKY67_07900 [Paludibacteraceae bacterium]|nr:hypothetical protein [Paludibacteraceae bacterium]
MHRRHYCRHYRQDYRHHYAKIASQKAKKTPGEKVGFIFEKVLDFLSLLWYVVVLTEKEAQPMKNMINELWHGNIVPQEDSRTNSPQMKELLGYMARHHEELEKSFTDEQKETFEKFHDCWSEYMSLAEAAIFEYAFRLGARLTMEVQKDTEE